MSDDWYEYCTVHNYVTTSYSCEPCESCPVDGCTGKMYRVEAHYKNTNSKYYKRDGGRLWPRQDGCLYHYLDDNTFCGRPTTSVGKYADSEPLCEEHLPAESKGLSVWGNDRCPRCHAWADIPKRPARSSNPFRPRWMPEWKYRLAMGVAA